MTPEAGASAMSGTETSAAAPALKEVNLNDIDEDECGGLDIDIDLDIAAIDADISAEDANKLRTDATLPSPPSAVPRCAFPPTPPSPPTRAKDVHRCSDPCSTGKYPGASAIPSVNEENQVPNIPPPVHA
jgi:hypothetical protein